jgi:hypothetical protein
LNSGTQYLLWILGINLSEFPPIAGAMPAPWVTQANGAEDDQNARIDMWQYNNF